MPLKQGTVGRIGGVIADDTGILSAATLLTVLFELLPFPVAVALLAPPYPLPPADVEDDFELPPFAVEDDVETELPPFAVCDWF